MAPSGILSYSIQESDISQVEVQWNRDVQATKGFSPKDLQSFRHIFCSTSKIIHIINNYDLLKTVEIL